MAAAAILEQEGHDFAEPIAIGAVNDRTAPALGSDKSRSGEDAEVRGLGSRSLTPCVGT